MQSSEYWNEVKDLAKAYTNSDYREALGASPDADRDKWLHETLDGHEFVICTYKARMVLEHSPNDTAQLDELGEIVDWHNPTPAAYMAMRADILEEV